MHRIYQIFDQLFDMIYVLLMLVLIGCMLYGKGITIETGIFAGTLLAIAIIYRVVVRVLLGVYFAASPMPAKKVYHPLVTVVFVAAAVVAVLFLVQKVLTAGIVTVSLTESFAWSMLEKVTHFANGFEDKIYYVFAATFPTITYQKKRGHIRCGMFVAVADACLLSGMLTNSTEIPTKALPIVAVCLVVYYPIVLFAYLRKKKLGMMDVGTLKGPGLPKGKQTNKKNKKPSIFEKLMDDIVTLIKPSSGGGKKKKSSGKKKGKSSRGGKSKGKSSSNSKSKNEKKPEQKQEKEEKLEEKKEDEFEDLQKKLEQQVIPEEWK